MLLQMNNFSDIVLPFSTIQRKTQPQHYREAFQNWKTIVYKSDHEGAAESDAMCTVRHGHCEKGANEANTKWNPHDLNHHFVFKYAKKHILSGKNHTYYFISLVPYDELDTLCNRAKSCCGTEESFAEQASTPSLRKWKSYCEKGFQKTGGQLIYLLSQFHFELEPTGG